MDRGCTKGIVGRRRTWRAQYDGPFPLWWPLSGNPRRGFRHVQVLRIPGSQPEVPAEADRHGAPGELEVEAGLDDDRVVVTLFDRAPTFDPTTVPEPDLSIPPEQRRPGGMGVHLIRLAMDEVRHALSGPAREAHRRTDNVRLPEGP